MTEEQPGRGTTGRAVRPSRDLLATPGGRRALFALLYLSEGAPIGFIWWALPATLTRAGVALETITSLTALVTLPWVLKFLVGPLIDASRIGLRLWIVGCQLWMGATLLPLIWIDWPAATDLLGFLLLAHATAAATQDVAIDTLAIRCVPAAELGRINGWMQTGMLAGRAGVAAGALAAAPLLGTAGIIGVLTALVWLPGLLLWFGTVEPARAATPPRRTREWLRALATPRVLAGAWIALTAAAGFEFAGVTAGPMLAKLGASDGRIATFFALIAPGGLAVGALLGGSLADRFGAGRVTIGAIFSILVLLTALAAALDGPGGSATAALALVFACAGCLTASSYALLMGLARGGPVATRYSFFMAMTNACEAWSGFVGGRLQSVVGGGYALLLVGAASLLAVPVIWSLRTESDIDG